MCGFAQLSAAVVNAQNVWNERDGRKRRELGGGGVVIGKGGTTGSILREHFSGKIYCLIELNSFLIKKFTLTGALKYRTFYDAM